MTTDSLSDLTDPGVEVDAGDDDRLPGDELTEDLLLEDVSIDGMCGVY